MFNKDVKVPLQEAELVDTSSSNTFVIALPLPSSLRRRQFCIHRHAAAGSAFVVVPPLPSLLSRHCLPRCAAAAFFVAPPVVDLLR